MKDEVQAIAIWLITEDQKVLLLADEESNGENLYQPIQKWKGDSESILGTNRRAIREFGGEEFAREFINQYPCCELPSIGKEKFSLRNNRSAVRFHYLAIITAEQLRLIPPSKASRIEVTRKDLSRLKIRRYPTRDDDIVLFLEHHKILCSLLLAHPSKIYKLFKNRREKTSPFFIF